MRSFKVQILLILLVLTLIHVNAITPKSYSESCQAVLVVDNDSVRPKLDLKKPELRVLDLGNSFTLDATHYLSLLIEAAEINCDDMCLYVALRPSASFKSWYDVYNDVDEKPYIFYKKAGGLEADLSGTAGPKNGEQFRNILRNNEWDLIIIHQRSIYSTDFDSWSSKSDSGYLNELLEILKIEQPQAALGFLLVHSTASSYSQNPEHSTYKQWEKIVATTEAMQENYDVELIIPYGTAIESLRNTECNNDLDLTADSLHLCSGLGDYTASCAYFEAIIAPRYDISVLGNTARLSNLTEENSVDVDDDNAYLAQLCAIEAIKNYKSIAEINNSEINGIIGIKDPFIVPDDEYYYDLSGRKFKNPSPGFYIHKGQKVFVN